MLESEFYGLTITPDTSPPSAPRRMWPALVTGAFIISAFALVLSILQPTLANIFGNSASSDPDNTRRQKTAAYLDLERDITSQLEVAQQQLEFIVQDADELTRSFQQLTGIPLDQAHVHSTRRIDHAILNSDAFTHEWVLLLNSRMTMETLEQIKRPVDLVKRHYQNQTLDVMHTSLLHNNLKMLHSKRDLLETQQLQLKRIAKQLSQ